MEPLFLSPVSGHYLYLYHSYLGKVILKEKWQLLSKMTERCGNDTES